MRRPNIDEYMMNILRVVATRATCARRRVGAVITDEKGHILATGYNGVPSGFPHCTDTPCAGAGDQPGDNTKCCAVHAETNAILQAGDRIAKATRMYCSATPCFSCAKLLIGTPIKVVIAEQLYADRAGLSLLNRGHITVFIAERNPDGSVSLNVYLEGEHSGK